MRMENKFVISFHCVKEAIFPQCVLNYFLLHDSQMYPALLRVHLLGESEVSGSFSVKC